MKTKILLWGVASILTAGIVSAVEPNWDAAVAFPAVGEPQVIHLDKGTKLTLLGTTRGYHHMAPGYEKLGGVNWIYTTTNTIVVWVKEEHEPSKRPSYELLVSDRANTGCVNIEPRQGSFVNDNVSLQSFVLSAFPRWDKDAILRVKPYMGAVSKERFILTNPAPVTFAHWTSEPLPATKSAGDLEVTLTKLKAGAPRPYREGSSRAMTNDPANQCVHLDFNFRVNGQSTTNWQAWPVQTTDAAGNWSRGLIYAYPTNGVRQIWGHMHSGAYIPPPEHYGRDGYYFQPGLWPDEPWKVRLEFIQRFNFSDGEIVAFTNLLIRPGSQQDADDEWSWDASNTNFTFIAQAKVNGVNLKLLPPLLSPYPYQDGRKRISVLVFADPNFNPQGMNLTLLEATGDQGQIVWSQFSPGGWAGHYNLEFIDPPDTKTLNLKLALHKSRFVEFTVKPTKQ